VIRPFSIETRSRVEFVKITHAVQQILADSEVQEGLCQIFVPHTTAGITINEGADPDVAADMVKELNQIVPFADGYLHAEGNSAAHIKASLMGSSVDVFIQEGQLLLGTWQAVFFCEFDGPRTRRVVVRVSG